MIVCFLYLGISAISCNKNSTQLPPIKAPQKELSVSAKINGLATVDLIFRQTQTATADTVWLSVKNTATASISNLQFVVELCKATPQQYDNCDLQVTRTLPDTIAPGGTVNNVYMWANKGIKLDAGLINTGIIAYTGLPPHPLADVYNNVYAVFEATDSAGNYYGNIRGYILADGTATFRLKGKADEYYNLEGNFTKMLSFNGRLMKDSQVLTPFALDSVGDAGSRKLVDTTGDALKFRVKLTTPINNTINSILSLTLRNQ